MKTENLIKAMHGFQMAHEDLRAAYVDVVHSRAIREAEFAWLLEESKWFINRLKATASQMGVEV